MDIVKRSGATEAYDGSKIVAAIAGAFSDVNREASEETLAALLRAAEESIAATDTRTTTCPAPTRRGRPGTTEAAGRT